MTAIRNVGLWFFSVVLSVCLFSLIYGQRYGFGSFAFVFRTTLLFALPVGCMYLPIAIALKDAEEGRIRTIAWSGVVIGPASLALWILILDFRGDGPSLWGGDEGGFGIVTCMTIALVVGCLTTAFYIIELKVIHHLTRSSLRAGAQPYSNGGAGTPS